MHTLLLFSIPNDVFRCNAWDKYSTEDHSQTLTIRMVKTSKVDPDHTFAVRLDKWSRVDHSLTFTIRLDQQRIVDPGQTFSKLRVQLRSKSDNSFRSNRKELILQVISNEKWYPNIRKFNQCETIFNHTWILLTIFLPVPLYRCIDANVCVDKGTLLNCIVYTLKCKFPAPNPKCLHRQGKNFSPWTLFAR